MAGINDLLGGLLGGQGGSPDLQKLVQPLMDMLQKSGGLQGLLSQLQGSSVGQQASSWISTGENMAVDPDALANAIGIDKVQDMANKAGVPLKQAEEGLSQLLPGLVDKLTPSGSIPGSDQIGDLLKQIPGGEQLSGMLGGLLGGGSSTPAPPA